MPLITGDTRITFGVSIHAPRCRRAMRDRLRQIGALIEFQSTPLVVEGRCLKTAAPTVPVPQFQSTPLVVEGRCDSVYWSPGSDYKFQSTPLVVEGRCHPKTSPRQCSTPFQSTPLVVEGRCVQGLMRRPARRRFNPRPSLSKGDARRNQRLRRQAEVSIHAPRCRRAMQNCNS